ncbi:MAG TPA: hypothetical protein ENJ45_06155 [Phaeodactylibacter sp.]|nr:hypothetical protein [Phaeodactylibacter sp.]
MKKITKSVKKGLQYFAYDGSIETSKVKAYEKWLSKQPNEDKEAKNKIFKEAKNGLHYLMPENYVVVLTKGGVTVDGELVVE